MIILMFMILDGALGSYPDITVTGTINKPGYKIECDPTHRPLVIEFLTDDRTECAIRTPKGSCNFLDFEHVDHKKILLVSKIEPYKDQKFGCEMIFKQHTDDYLKIHCSVKFNGTDFVQIPKQITHIADFSYTGDESIDKTAQDHTLVTVVVVASILLLAIEIILCVVYRRKSNRESTSRTRQKKNIHIGDDMNEL